MTVSFEVAHAIPGRVRLRLPHIKDDQDAAEQVAAALMMRSGVTSVRVNPSCASVTVCYDKRIIRTFAPEEQLRGLVFSENGGQISISKRRNGHRKEGLKSILARASKLILPTAALAVSILGKALPVTPVYSLVAAAATPVFQRALNTIKRERRLGVDFLDATAIAVMGAQRNISTCAFMAWLIGIGEHIREETARRSEKAVSDLLAFHGSTAIVLRGRKRVMVKASELAVGDVVVVHAGDGVPVDGVVVCGHGAVSQKSLTGESALVERSPGDQVFAGSVSVDGELMVESTAVGCDTRAGQIVEMLRAAPAHDTRIEDYAARFADKLVLPTFAISGVVYALSRSITRALSMLIVDFGTGIRVAAPTAFLSHMATAARNNIVIKGGRAMEKLAGIDTVVFDKTGTLTTGHPEVRNVVLFRNGVSEKEVLRLAAAAEAGLNHPIAKALTAKACAEGIDIPCRVEAQLRVGLGVRAYVEGQNVLVGSERMMRREYVDITQAIEFIDECRRKAESPLFVAVDSSLVGAVTCADRIRSDSFDVISGLRNLGIKKIVMLTGDKDEVAAVAARELGIDEFYSEIFPDAKLQIIRRLQKEGRTVAVVGDGLNDALALTHADVAVAPAGATDAAKNAADILLMEDDLHLLTKALGIARSAVDLVRQNYKIVAFPNAGAIALAAAGMLGPPLATLINNGSTVAAGVNGLKPLLIKRNGNGRHKHSASVEIVKTRVFSNLTQG